MVDLGDLVGEVDGDRIVGDSFVQCSACDGIGFSYTGKGKVRHQTIVERP